VFPRAQYWARFYFSFTSMIYHNCTASSLKLFADGTCLIVTCNSIENLKRKVSEDLENTSSWLNANKLTLNHTKSNIIIVPPKSNISSTNVADTFQRSQISIANDSKYLGVILDKDLSFCSHIKQFQTQLSKSVSILNKVKPFLDTSALLQLYYSIFQSYLQYGIIV